MRERLRAWQPSPYRGVLAFGVLLIGMATCWSIVQPLRAENAQDAVANRISAGEYAAASQIALIAQQRNPLSVEPWYLLATSRAYQGDQKGTVLALVEAVKTQPANSEAWRRLGNTSCPCSTTPRARSPRSRPLTTLIPSSPEVSPT